MWSTAHARSTPKYAMHRATSAGMKIDHQHTFEMEAIDCSDDPSENSRSICRKVVAYFRRMPPEIVLTFNGNSFNLHWLDFWSNGAMVRYLKSGEVIHVDLLLLCRNVSPHLREHLGFTLDEVLKAILGSSKDTHLPSTHIVELHPLTTPIYQKINYKKF